MLTSLVDLFYFLNETLEDRSVTRQKPILRINIEVTQNWTDTLSDSIDAAIALDERDDGPRQIVMNNVMAFVVQVNAFARSVRCDQHSHVSRARSERFHNFHEVDIGARPIDGSNDLGGLILELGRERSDLKIFG